MDAFFARLKDPDLAPAVDDGLIDTFLTQVDFDPAAPEQLRLTLSLRGRTWPGTAVREDWRVTVDGVALQVLQLGRCAFLQFADDHPLVEEMRAEWAMLRGLNLPPDTREVEALLQRFGAQSHPLSGSFEGIHPLEDQPRELFALGPLPRLQTLGEELSRHGLQTRLETQAALPNRRADLKLLQLGSLAGGGPRSPEALILAQSFHATRLP